MSGERWRLWIDTGGTFTDCLAVNPQGELLRAKVLSSAALRARVAAVEGPRALALDEGWGLPDGFFVGARFRLLGQAGAGAKVTAYGAAARRLELAGDPGPGLQVGRRCELAVEVEAPVLAAHVVTGTPLGDDLPPLAMRLATTRATNALLERRGAPTVLFVTRGFSDLELIGTQQRPDLFALQIVKPPPLYESVVEVRERMAADGQVLEELHLDELRSAAEAALARNVRSAAVVLLHAWRNPDHERALAAALRGWGFDHVSCSAALAPMIGALPRAETAVVDAYLAPVIGDYVADVARAVPVGTLHVMTSAGGLVGAAGLRPKDTLLSGPAGGVVGAAGAARRSGFARAITFDMGGTSTDVARWDGRHDYLFEHRVGDAHLLAPALAVETVAAGGGSVCAFRGQGLQVGPASAGADPGPACYGAGGPLTLTDLNLLLGRIDADELQIPVDPGAAARALDEIRRTLLTATGEDTAAETLAEGFLRIANERMAAAIRRISVRRGYDPAEYALLAFGGAGPQHACAVAALLGIDAVLIPADAGLLSAAGVGAAVIERFAERQLLEPLAGLESRLEALFSALAEEAREAVVEEGVPSEEVVVRRRLAHLRLLGQDSTLAVEWEQGSDLGASFATRYRETYGYDPPSRPVEVESVRVVASSAAAVQEEIEHPSRWSRPEPRAVRRAFFDGAWRDAGVHRRSDLRPGAEVEGPALVVEAHSVTALEPGWRLRVDGASGLRLERIRDGGAGSTEAAPVKETEAVRLELFSHRFEAIAADMGEMLRRCALSTNIKERLDFSCGLLDERGRLVVNAPHIPVHLGALTLCVQRVLDEMTLEEGDTVITNHPGFGGSHLPDITAVTPVFAAGRRIAFVASRAHHAELGGTRPGSVPPDATCLAEEGVVIPPTYLVRCGRPRWEAVRRLLAEATWPSRAVEENLADLAAAVAANRLGVRALAALAEEAGPEVLAQHMDDLRGRATILVEEALQRLPDGVLEAVERLDDGSPLAVRITVAGRQATISFAGSAPVHPGNLNATPAVVRAVVMYVLRLLVAEPVPLNEGLMTPVTLDIPPGILNPVFAADPRVAPAVVGGNVETSQRLVDVLLKALGLAACSQGTMNNLVFGSESFGYYETVGGGAGAGPGFPGADAVHTHMTNTRATDPEVLEHRYPVRLERWAVRRGSGGAGAFRGGDGIARELRFLAPLSLSLLAQHRREEPYGAAGGAPGARGRQRLARADGEVLALEGIAGCEVLPGDLLILETPGGGGWGRPDPRSGSTRVGARHRRR